MCLTPAGPPLVSDFTKAGRTNNRIFHGIYGPLIGPVMTFWALELFPPLILRSNQ